MNESTFYEGIINLPKLKVRLVEKEAAKIIFHCSYEIGSAKCPVCTKSTQKINQATTFKFRDLKISEKEVWLHLDIPQFVCPDCNRFFYQHPDWVMRGKSYTKRQAKWIFELCKKQSFTQAACLVDMCHKTIERLYYDYARLAINLPKRYAEVRKLGIDEIAHRKGKQDYACVLTDLERGIQLDILKDRKKATLLAHFKSLGEDFCNQIEVVSCDIWKAYINVGHEVFPNCEVVIDRFHVVKALNNVLDIQRKELRKEFKDEDCFKSLKWILYKRHEKCTEEQLATLKKAFEKSWQLEELYELRKSFNAAFDIAQDKGELKKILHAWKNHAKTLNYPPLNAFVRTLTNWKDEIAAFANSHISNAVTEGLNNYLRYFKRISFGLPNFEHMRLRVLAAQV